MGKDIERWRLGDLTVDVGTQTIVRHDQTIVLPRLSFQFLLELIRAAPNVVSIDALIDRVWDGVFVNGETVTQRAKLLRDALGDDPREPRYFAARRGIGYQLLSTPVRIDELEGKARSYPVAFARWRAMPAAGVLAVLVAGGVGAVAYHRQGDELPHQQSMRVLVLPFDDLSRVRGDDYISDGLSEIILNRLSSVRGLTVISRETALLSKVADATPYTASRKLDADFVVKGSVQRVGETLRVTCFVFDGAKDARMWSQSYDWPVNKLYALQDRIAEQIAGQIAANSGSVGNLQPASSSPGNPDAYLAYLKGKSMLGRFRVAETEAAAVQFQRAVALDPNFAPAMVALFDARMQAASLRNEDLRAVHARNEPLLRRAKQIDPQSGALLFAEAMWSDLPRKERLALYERAAEKDSSNSRGLVAYAKFLEWGRPDDQPSAQGRQLMDRVMSIDPLSADAQFWAVQRDVFYSRPPDEVESAMRRALALDPNNILLANRFAMRRWRIDGETAEAIGLLEQIIATDPDYARNAQLAVPMYLDVGDPAAAQAVAATTPATRDSSRVPLDIYAGNWRAAGEAALGSRGFVFNQFENWLWPEAVRDYALKTGQIERGAQAIAARYDFNLADPHVSSLYQLGPSAPLAQLLQAQGKIKLAQRLLAQTVRWVDEHQKLGLAGGNGRTKAQALMLLGARDQALSVLLAATGQARDIRHCWYLVKYDPIWVPVRNDPRFRQTVKLCVASIKTQRALVDAARRAGKVPKRVA